MSIEFEEIVKLPSRKLGRSTRPRPLKDADHSLNRVNGTILFSRNENVFFEGELAKYLYEIKSGCIRTYNILSDGRRQIGSFYFPGEYFGLEATCTHSTSAEAVTRCRAHFINREAVTSDTANNIATTSRLLALTTMELHRNRKRAQLLLKSAQERMVSFILEIADREHTLDEIELPMIRQDIADYLGLSIETVSRMLSRLERADLICMPTSRRIVLRDLSALELLR